MRLDRAVRGAAVLALAVVALCVPRGAQASSFTLTNGAGDGQVTVGVDGFGSFGSATGSDTANAVYNPVGAGTAAGTTFESWVAIQIGAAGGARQALSTAYALTNPLVTGSPTSGSSSFSFGGLNFTLTQILTTLSSGSQLEQTYTITNASTSQQTIDFELVRYLDGDLLFDGSLNDGGGRLTGPETLFETDSATGGSTSTTFVGIRATGGTTPLTNRYEVDSYSGLRGRILAGTALDDLITNDGGDADQFIDAGFGYDVTLALRNTFSLGFGQSATYTTTTIWGSGTPEDRGGPSPVPEPTSLLLLGSGVALVALRLRRAR